MAVAGTVRAADRLQWDARRTTPLGAHHGPPARTTQPRVREGGTSIRNVIAHAGGHHKVTPVDAARKLSDLAEIINQLWGHPTLAAGYTLPRYSERSSPSAGARMAVTTCDAGRESAHPIHEAPDWHTSSSAHTWIPPHCVLIGVCLSSTSRHSTFALSRRVTVTLGEVCCQVGVWRRRRG